MTKVYRLYAMGGEWGDSYEKTIGIYSSYDNAWNAMNDIFGEDAIYATEDFFKVPPITKTWHWHTKHTGIYGDGETLVIEEWELDKE